MLWYYKCPFINYGSFKLVQQAYCGEKKPNLHAMELITCKCTIAWGKRQSWGGRGLTLIAQLGR